MLVRAMPNGQLFCVNQTSHALMAAEFCRHWGNRDFAKPEPYEVVLAAIAQHDNGWYEWETAPEVDTSGAPLAFIPGPHYATKLEIWQRGIRRAAAQHPYMGLMISRHATLLYAGDLMRLGEEEVRATQRFMAQQEQWTNEVRVLLANHVDLARAAAETGLMARTRLLQFGDSSSLQVAMPWGHERTFPNCPVDFEGSYTNITLTWAGQEISFEPWPFGLPAFTVGVHGRLLNRRTFSSHAEYQAALAAAPLHTMTWQVTRN